jgi:hypothetical protein
VAPAAERANCSCEAGSGTAPDASCDRGGWKGIGHALLIWEVRPGIAAVAHATPRWKTPSQKSGPGLPVILKPLDRSADAVRRIPPHATMRAFHSLTGCIHPRMARCTPTAFRSRLRRTGVGRQQRRERVGRQDGFSGTAR